tara:strand:- start:6332 stop:6961 length:630 start_codon:yes stop_codon:yes gene_type:complete
MTTSTTTTTNNTLHLSEDDTASFIAAVKAVATSASTDQARAILCNVLIEISDNEIKLSATNSYMLTIVTLSGPTWINNINAKFHVVAKHLVKAMPTGTKNHMSLEVTDGVFVINSESKIDHLSMQAGEFPNIKGLTSGYEKVTDKLGVDFALNPKFASTLLKQAEVFRGKNSEAPVVIKAAETHMKPIHMKCNVIDRGEWYALIMPVRL